MLSSSMIAEQFGVTNRTVERWAELGSANFPAPDFVINGRRYWRTSTFRAWELENANAHTCAIVGA